jgi:hypothetical protein
MFPAHGGKYRNAFIQIALVFYQLINLFIMFQQFNGQPTGIVCLLLISYPEKEFLII